VLAVSPPHLHDYRDELGLELDAIVQRCLEKEQHERFGSVSELAQALLPFGSPPLHTAALSLETSVEVAARGAAKAGDLQPEPDPSSAALPLRRTPGYGSLTPLHAGSLGSGSSRPMRRTWPLALALVVVPVLLFAAFGARALPPPAAGTATDEPSTALVPAREPPLLLQYLDDARAVPEADRPSGAESAADWLTRKERQARAADDEAWLRSQELKRLHDVQNRYGL
jgi:hypothetical protein